MDGRPDMKLIVAFGNFVNAPQIFSHYFEPVVYKLAFQPEEFSSPSARISNRQFLIKMKYWTSPCNAV